jgi:predicted RNA-binding protein Jag
MDNWKEFAEKTIQLMGFGDYKVEVDDEHRHGSIYIYDHQNLVKDNLPSLIDSLNHLIQLVAKKNNTSPIFFDFNNYRRERENLIAELARTAARKVLATKKELSLPAMNSYERRLVHVELATNPSVRTESLGIGKERYVVIYPILEDNS